MNDINYMTNYSLDKKFSEKEIPFSGDLNDCNNFCISSNSLDKKKK